MTPQEIFDTVARHLFTQGERAGREHRDEDGEVYDFECLYRAPSGKTCAMGALLPDAAYRADMEGSDAVRLCRIYDDVLPEWMPPNAELLQRLQEVHDYHLNWKDDAAMKFALGWVADAYELDKSILDTLSFGHAEA
jgi:hypothetical protein